MGSAEFRLLGPVEARSGGQPVNIGHARQRLVLAALLLDANRPVSADQLIERVWGDRRRPDRPRNALQTYVSLLRRSLAAIDEVTIARHADGYLIRLDEQLVDVHEFRAAARAARAAADDNRAIALFEQALGLWRGEAFGLLDSAWLHGVRVTLSKERQAAERDLTDIQLRNGWHGQLLARLAEWVGEYPLDERLSGQLMLALCRAGRQAEALRHYQHLRQQLADELGADPGPALQRLHRQILAGDPALAIPAAPPAPAPAWPALPRQLPARPRRFTGRARELAMISDAAAAGDEPDGGMTLVTISGGGGIGKTWLALQWAHQNLARFPDGQLYVSLRGFDPSGEPVHPATARRGFLDALGVDPAAIPADPGAQAGLYRSLLADRRMLIVLDNARDTAHVSPLLPGSPACVVLVTSRQSLTGLIAAHGARPLELDVLSGAESRELLTRYLGRARAAAEPDAVAELAAACAGLPLAISIAAARAVTRPGLPLAVLGAEIRDSSARLDALADGDLASVRAVLSWSHDALGAEAAAVLGLLALAPGPDISGPAAASLAARPAGRVRSALRDLDGAHLIQQHAPGRYRMHDLVRLYSAERASADQPPDRRAAAARRLVDFYLHTAGASDPLLAPQRPPISLGEPTSGCVPLVPADPAAALAWFDAEHAGLLAAQHLARSQGWNTAVWQLAWAMNTFHQRRGHLSDQVATWQLALAAAEQLSDPAVLVLVHRWFGHACAQAGRSADALDHLRRALAVAERSGDPVGQAHTHHILARAWEQERDDHQALAHARRALGLYQELGHRVWEAQALNSTGYFHARLGDFAEARAACGAALRLHREHRYPDGEAGTLDSLGYIAHRAGDHAQALDCYRQALAIYLQRGNAYAEAETLDAMAQVQVALGQHDQARASWERSLELYQAQHRLADTARVRHQLAAVR